MINLKCFYIRLRTIGQFSFGFFSIRPAAANNFKKSRREILSSPRCVGGVDITIDDEKIFYKPLFLILKLDKREQERALFSYVFKSLTLIIPFK